MNIRMRINQVFTSRFEWIRASADGSRYPLDAVGVKSAQYLGGQSTDPRTSISVSRDGYVVETND